VLQPSNKVLCSKVKKFEEIKLATLFYSQKKA